MGLALAAAGGVLACERTLTGPIPVSYLAVVALVDAPPGFSATGRYSYRVRELSGKLAIDTTIVASPRDTVIVRLPPATYTVTLSGLPDVCESRYSLQQYVVVVDPPSTSLARYYVSCEDALTVHVFTDGTHADSQMVYRLIAPDGGERLGIVGAGDTLRFDRLTPGLYEFALSVIAPNCVVTSDGGTRSHVTVAPSGGTVLDVRIACSDEGLRPHMVHAAATYRQGVSAFMFQATDPDRDVERYVWDVTDCRGSSVVPGGARTRRGLSSGRTFDRETVTVVGAFEAGLADDAVAGRCTALRVVDQQGNTTPVLELPIRPGSTQSPRATVFNAYSVGVTAIRTELAATDPDGDFVGTFVAARLRDGVLSPPNGEPDLGIYTAAGYLGDAVPDLPLGSRFQYGDVSAIIVYLIDWAGNFTRLEDADVFR